MHAAQPIPRLSPTEAQILETFLNPEATFLAVAQSLKLDLQQLLDALTGPAIRAALNALSELDAIRRRLSLAPIVPGALAALKRLLDQNDKPAEVRRAATTILTTYTRLERGVTRGVPRLDWPLRAPASPIAPSAGNPRDASCAPVERPAPNTNGHATPTAPDSARAPRPDRPLHTPASASGSTAGKSEIRRGGPCDASSTPAPHANGHAAPAPTLVLPRQRGLTCSGITPAALVAAAGRAVSVYDLLPQTARAPPPCHDLPAPPALRAAA